MIALFRKALQRVADFFNPAPAPARPQFVHLVGSFDQARIKLEGEDIEIRHKPAQGRISSHFTVKAGDTTYVFWDRPDATQQQIQSGRKNHHQVGDDQTVSITRNGLSIESPASAFASSALNGAARALSEKIHAQRTQLALNHARFMP